MVSMSSLGAFSGTIRFLTYTPWFVLVFYAFPVYEEVKSHPELYHAPYNTKVPTAAACAGIAVSRIHASFKILAKAGKRKEHGVNR